VESKAVQAIASNGVTQPQADVLVNEVHPAVVAVVGATAPTPVQKQAIHDSMQKVLNVSF